MATSERICCVPGCGKSRADDTVLHSFPNPDKDKERFLAWIQTIGTGVSSLDHHYVYKRRRVCHAHFETKYLTWTRRLSPGAVPTLLIPACPPPRVPMRDITNVEDVGTTGETSGAPISTEKTNERKSSKKIPYIDDKKALENTINKLSKKNEKYTARLKKAMKLSENKTFQNALRKFSTLAALFTIMQFREVGKKKFGRRFTQPEKIMALSLYKRSPRAYRWLKNIFVLPSPLTLNRLISRTNLKPGINKNLFQQLETKIQKMKADDKLCILLFDEMAIAPHFDYNLRKDIITGFVCNGEETIKKISDHALVFMVRGIMRNYKQPVAYTFCSGSTSKTELTNMIRNIIRKLHSVGLRVLATVCDQGTSNVSAINSLINDTKAHYLKKNKEMRHDVFEVDEHEVIPLFDPPHLIKGIRNNLLEKDLKCTIDGSIKIAKWQHVVNLHNEDPAYKGIRLVKKLTEQHINPDNFQKMKVKFATQVISQKVAVTMGYLAENNTLPQECTQTADVFLFLDELFDSLNGSFENSRKKSGKALLRAVTPKSDHHCVWSKSKPVLSSMKFIIREKTNKEVTVPTINNWFRTVDNVEYLIKILVSRYNIKSVWMRHFNQDPLENFFGSIRSHGCRNTNPTPAGFESSFASLLITNLSGQHSIGSNCEEDKCKMIFKSMRLLFENPNIFAPNELLEINFDNVYEDFSVKKGNPRILAQLQYVTGYLLKKTKKNIFKGCSSCKECLYDRNGASRFLTIREFIKGKYFLTYPSDSLVMAFSKVQDLVTYVLKTSPTMPNIKAYLKTIIYLDIDFEFITCAEHKSGVVDYIVELSCRFFIFNWCKDVNKLITGAKLETLDHDDDVKVMASNYFKKRRHLKKKS